MLSDSLEVSVVFRKKMSGRIMATMNMMTILKITTAIILY